MEDIFLQIPTHAPLWNYRPNIFSYFCQQLLILCICKFVNPELRAGGEQHQQAGDWLLQLPLDSHLPSLPHLPTLPPVPLPHPPLSLASPLPLLGTTIPQEISQPPSSHQSQQKVRFHKSFGGGEKLVLIANK